MARSKLKRGVRRTKRTVGAEVRWRGIIADHLSSGKSVPAFCSERGLSKEMLYKWRKRFKVADADTDVTCLKKAVEKQTPPKLIPVKITARQNQTWGVEIAFPAGHTVRIAHGIDAGVITAILATMRTVAC
jgi:transposase-like protein